jgi:DNA-binding GntR family transcriptional regulator
MEGPERTADERSATVSRPKLVTINDRPGWTGCAAPKRFRQTSELDGVYRIRRLVEPELAAKACLLLTDAELDELEASLARFPAADPVELGRAARAWLTRLLAPAATPWDLRVLAPLWEETDRCLCAQPDRLGLRPPHAPDSVLPGRELLDSFRTRDPELARAACRRQLDDEARRLCGCC